MYLTQAQRNIERKWIPLYNLTESYAVLPQDFQVVDRHEKSVEILDHCTIWKDPKSSKVALYITKNHWAIGRKLKIQSKIEAVWSGEYRIVDKADSNSYDTENFLVIEPLMPKFESGSKALSWLEREVAKLEKKGV